jgi:choloylglycine hydrolase
MGAVGLPGDLSSDSRFVRAAFTRLHSLSGETEEESVSQFFHILQTVAQTRGCVRLDTGNEITVYSSCCNTDKGIYYYTTYENRQVLGVDLHQEDLDGTELVSYPMETQLHIQIQNAKSRPV